MRPGPVGERSGPEVRPAPTGPAVGSQQHFVSAVGQENTVVYFDTDRYNIDAEDTRRLQKQTDLRAASITVDFTAPELGAAWKDVLDGKETWMLASYESKSKLKLVGKGSGGFAELVDADGATLTDALGIDADAARVLAVDQALIDPLCTIVLIDGGEAAAEVGGAAYDARGRYLVAAFRDGDETGSGAAWLTVTTYSFSCWSVRKSRAVVGHTRLNDE